MPLDMNNLPEDKIEDEVARQMTVPRMEPPNEKDFKPFIKPEDIDDFEDRDKRMLLAVSVLEQKLDFIIRWQVSTHRHLRMVEAEGIRHRMAQAAREKEDIKTQLRWKILIWLSAVTGGGVVAAGIKKAFDKLWP